MDWFVVLVSNGNQMRFILFYFLYLIVLLFSYINVNVISCPDFVYPTILDYFNSIWVFFLRDTLVKPADVRFDRGKLVIVTCAFRKYLQVPTYGNFRGTNLCRNIFLREFIFAICIFKYIAWTIFYDFVFSDSCKRYIDFLI